METILLIRCQVCGKVRQYGEWIAMRGQDLQKIQQEARMHNISIQNVFDLCPKCANGNFGNTKFSYYFAKNHGN